MNHKPLLKKRVSILKIIYSPHIKTQLNIILTWIVSVLFKQLYYCLYNYRQIINCIKLPIELRQIY